MKQYQIFFVLALFLLSCGTNDEKKKKLFYDTSDNQAIDFANLTADSLLVASAENEINVERQISAIIEEPINEFDKIISPLDRLYLTNRSLGGIAQVFFLCSTDSVERATGNQVYRSILKQMDDVFTRKPFYNRIKSYAESEDFASQSSDRQKNVTDLLKSMENNGIHLEGDDLTYFKSLIDSIRIYRTAFTTNLNNDQTIIMINPLDAGGIPDRIINRSVENKMIAIPVIQSNYAPVMRNAVNESVRKKMFFAFNNRAADKNMSNLDTLLMLRHKLATHLGYGSYAEYRLENRMAKKPETVWQFLQEMKGRAQEKAQQDQKELIELGKDVFSGSLDQKIDAWDTRYMMEQIMKSNFDVDREKIREYFSKEACLKGMMDTYQQLLGYEFKKMENPSVWHEDVQAYEVFENTELIGRFYLDLFPRPGKETWFYSVGLSPGKNTSEGKIIPNNMLLANFSPPTEDMPSLLYFRELRILFHEFGHVMGAMAFNGELASQNGSEGDFGEALSQIFENWVWDYPTLSKLSSHYLTDEKLPKEVFDKLRATKTLGSGLGVLRKIRGSMYDMTLYDKYDPDNPVDTDEIWRELDRQFDLDIGGYVEGTHRQANWIHPNTHPVYTYGYMWSEVYAQDMFTRFEEKGLDDPETGEAYKTIVLGNGSQRPSLEAVKEFLGRPSNSEAYFRNLGLE